MALVPQTMSAGRGHLVQHVVLVKRYACIFGGSGDMTRSTEGIPYKTIIFVSRFYRHIVKTWVWLVCGQAKRLLHLRSRIHVAEGFEGITGIHLCLLQLLTMFGICNWIRWGSTNELTVAIEVLDISWLLSSLNRLTKNCTLFLSFDYRDS